MSTAKILLRKELIGKINALTDAEISRQSDAVCRKLVQNNNFNDAKVIAIYLSMEKELHTTQLFEHIFAEKKECFIPRFQMGAANMEMIQLNSLEDLYSLPKNKWGIRQPPEDHLRRSVFDGDSLDVVVLPGLAFTKTGKRLGRGKGYYDKFLETCHTSFSVPPYTIGLALNQQILSDIPVSSHDVNLDLVIYENS